MIGYLYDLGRWTAITSDAIVGKLDRPSSSQARPPDTARQGDARSARIPHMQTGSATVSVQSVRLKGKIKQDRNYH